MLENRIEPPGLHAGEIHVWRLDLAGEFPASSARLLADADLERARRFAFDRDRNRFLNARSFLRLLLGSYLRMPPRQVPIEIAFHGKPFLAPEFALGFNMSHSGNMGLLALGLSPEIGIDVETIEPVADMRQTASILFTTEEMASLDEADDGNSPVAFLTCWTRKEAYLKALGLGLTVEPRAVCVGTDPDRRCIAITGRTSGDYVEVASLVQDASCTAALAVIGGYSQATVFDLAGNSPPAQSSLPRSRW
jgi:4'-phosphopantetheinyl transferase